MPPAEAIQASTVRTEVNGGLVLEVCFSGRYPPGSFGNEHAARMVELASAAITHHQPDAVLFNLKDLSYVWSDAICDLAMTIHDKKTKIFLPACVYAEGRTASALRGLFANGWLFVHAGMKLFCDRADAATYLQERLPQGAG